MTTRNISHQHPAAGLGPLKRGQRCRVTSPKVWGSQHRLAAHSSREDVQQAGHHPTVPCPECQWQHVGHLAHAGPIGGSREEGQAGGL